MTNLKWFRSKLWRLLGLALAVCAFCAPLQAAAPALPGPVVQERGMLLHQKWSPARLYSILTSHDPQAREDLYRAAFAAGPAIIPKLENALKDDRTATFAAQVLAYFGDAQSIAILAKLVNDPRNLDLRRFYYGALGGRNNPHDIDILLNKIQTSDHEPDRLVTRDAILALSISSDPVLVPRLRQAEKDVTDPVIQDDIETAARVVSLRARYLASPAGKAAGHSLKQAIRSYFMPALEPAQESSQAGIRVRNLTYSPNRERVLAAVDAENPMAVAVYHLVLQKDQAGWKVASIWLGEEYDKSHPSSQQVPQK